MVATSSAPTSPGAALDIAWRTWNSSCISHRHASLTGMHLSQTLHSFSKMFVHHSTIPRKALAYEVIGAVCRLTQTWITIWSGNAWEAPKKSWNASQITHRSLPNAVRLPYSLAGKEFLWISAYFSPPCSAHDFPSPERRQWSMI